LIKIVLTTSLLNDIRDNAKARIGTNFTHGAAGTGTATPAASDTTLGTEVFRDARDEFDDAPSNTVTTQLRILTTEANGNTLAEAGWFNQNSGGTMWSRNTFTAINKTSDIQLFLDTQITFTITETT